VGPFCKDDVPQLLNLAVSLQLGISHSDYGDAGFWGTSQNCFPVPMDSQASENERGTVTHHPPPWILVSDLALDIQRRHHMREVHSIGNNRFSSTAAFEKAGFFIKGLDDSLQ
jgi:hypothetical protein